MSTTSNERLYHVLEARAIDEDAGLPDQETLAEIVSALHGVSEFLLDGAMSAILKVAIKGEPNTITYEDIGRLIVWADDVADHASTIMSIAARVHVAARESHSIAAGFQGDLECLFKENGLVKEQVHFDRVIGRFRDA